MYKMGVTGSVSFTGNICFSCLLRVRGGVGKGEEGKREEGERKRQEEVGGEKEDR